MKLINRHVWNSKPSGLIHQFKIRREAQANFAFQFERQPRKASGQSFDFLKRICPAKNRENFSILHIRNTLSDRHL